MSVTAFGIVNFVLAAMVLITIPGLLLWAIRTAHRDHVPVVEPARVIAVEPVEQIELGDLPVGTVLA